MIICSSADILQIIFNRILSFSPPASVLITVVADVINHREDLDFEKVPWGFIQQHVMG